MAIDRGIGEPQCSLISDTLVGNVSIDSTLHSPDQLCVGRNRSHVVSGECPDPRLQTPVTQSIGRARQLTRDQETHLVCDVHGLASVLPRESSVATLDNSKDGVRASGLHC